MYFFVNSGKVGVIFLYVASYRFSGGVHICTPRHNTRVVFCK